MKIDGRELTVTEFREERGVRSEKETALFTVFTRKNVNKVRLTLSLSEDEVYYVNSLIFKNSVSLSETPHGSLTCRIVMVRNRFEGVRIRCEVDGVPE